MSEELKDKNSESLKIEEDLNQMKNRYETEIPKEYKIKYKKQFEEEINKKQLQNGNEESDNKDNKKNCIIF